MKQERKQYVFNYHGKKVRALYVPIDDEPKCGIKLVAVKDIANLLGIKNENIILRKLDPEGYWKEKFTDKNGNTVNFNVITEETLFVSDLNDYLMLNTEVANWLEEMLCRIDNDQAMLTFYEDIRGTEYEGEFSDIAYLHHRAILLAGAAIRDLVNYKEHNEKLIKGYEEYTKRTKMVFSLLVSCMPDMPQYIRNALNEII